MRDLILGFRSLRGAPGVTVAAILSLALGIGASTALFTVTRQVLLAPLPWPDAGRLVMLWETSPESSSRWVAPANFIDWRRDLIGTVASLAAFDSVSITLTGRGEAERLRGASASGTFFSTLGQGAAEGRVLSEADDAPGAPCVAVLGAGLRDRRFPGGDAVGTSIVVNDRPCTVVGVLPRTFAFPLMARAEIWINGDRGVPRSFPFGGDPTTVRDAHLLFVVARLAPGVSLDAASGHLARLAASLARAYPDTNTGLGGRVQPLHEAIVGDVRRPLWLLQAGVMVLWLVACVNVAHLLMGRASRRAHELAVRVALGARRRDLVRQCLGEALAYALPGGALGLLLALWTVDGLVALAPPALPRLGEIAVEPQTVLAALVCTLGATLLVGLVPAWWTGGAPAAGLQASTTRTSAAPGARRWQRGLVIGELALAQVLVVGAWLFASSFAAATRVPLGFVPEGRLVAELPLTRRASDDTDAGPLARRQFLDHVLADLAATPGVRRAAAGFTAPLAGAPNRGVRIVGAPEPPPGQEPTADFQAITPDFFRALGTPLTAGRGFTASDDERADPVAIVNARFVTVYFGDQSPLDREITFGDGYRHRIVGVVGDTRYRRVEQAPDPAFYVPSAQSQEFWPYLALVAEGHTNSDPALLAAAVRRAVRAADPRQPVAGIRPLRAVVDEALAGRRINTAMVAAFGILALLMAAVGAYGVMASLATAREREFSIRAALGAPATALGAGLLREAAVLALAAVAAGQIAAAIAGRAWQSLLFGVSAGDPRLLAAAGATLVATALLACGPAALRVARANPVDALRRER